MIIKGIAMKMTGLFLLMTLLVPPTIARADDFARLSRESSRISTISADFVQKKS